MSNQKIIEVKNLTKKYGELIAVNIARKRERETGQILNFREEGRSYPFIEKGLFGYCLANYEVASRYIVEYAKQYKPNKDNKMQILEIGCGVGWGAKYIKDRLESREIEHLDLIATDKITNEVDKKTLEYNKSVYKEEGIRFEEANALDLPEKFKDKVDIVVMNEVIEHFGQKEQNQALGQIKKVLKKGGLLLMSTPSLEPHAKQSGKQNELHKFVYANRQDLEKLIKTNFNIFQVNRITNEKHVRHFDPRPKERNLPSEFWPFHRWELFKRKIRSFPKGMFKQYRYEKGDKETDKKHREKRDTCTFYVVAQKE